MTKCWLLTQGITHPVELLIPVVVLGGTQSVGDSLNAVDDWAGEIVNGIDPAEGGREGVRKVTSRRQTTNLVGSENCDTCSLSGEQGDDS